MQYLTIWDLVLTPIYLLILTFLARRHRDRHYPKGHHLRPYYLPGLLVKLGGAIFIGLIYQFYYNGGDTFNYFTHSRIINSSLEDGFLLWTRLLGRAHPDTDLRIYEYAAQMEWYNDPASYTVGAIGAVLGLLNWTTYLPIALLFAYISYTGIWAMYRTFVQLYPHLTRELAVAFLFIPSTFVWGSALFKDTVCMFALGWLVYTTFRIIFHRDLSVRNLTLLAVSFYLLAVIKIYILLAFLPALTFWLLMTYSKRIRTAAIRWVINIGVISMIVAGFLFFSQRFSDELNKYSLERIAQTAQTTRTYITSVSEAQEGAAYSLSPMDGSLGGLLQSMPEAVVVTLFRPFPWEINKVIVALSAMESFLFLFFTLRLILTRRRVFALLLRDPTITFCLIYSVIFAFAVGVSSGNFGALSRYKIPCLPFYAAFLVILYFYEKKATAVTRPVQQGRQRLQPAI